MEAEFSSFLAIGVSGTVSWVACSAKPYIGKTETELNEYVGKRWKKFILLFPHYDEPLHWDVHLLFKSLFGHYAMLFVTPGHIEGFLIHLVVNERKETEFRLDAVNLRSYSDDHPDLNALSLGTTEEFTAKRIITKAHDRLVKMGRYHTIFNNCQDYCTKVASDIEVSNICKLWSEELNKILQGIASVTTTGAVAVGAAVESVQCMQRVEPQTGSSLIKPIKDLYEYHNATTKKNV